MCNINYLWRKENIKAMDLSFLDTVTFNSFTRNPDGEGYLTSGVLVKKSTGKLLFKNEDKIVGNKWVAVHERYATHGSKGIDNVHPLVAGRVILLHNGVLHTEADKVKSDSRIFAELLNKRVGNTANFAHHFKELVEEIGGSKSIFAYDKKFKRLYYYKNDQTSFYFVRGKKCLFASTTHENVAYAKRFYCLKGKIMSVPSNKVFEIRGMKWLDVASTNETEYFKKDLTAGAQQKLEFYKSGIDYQEDCPVCYGMGSCTFCDKQGKQATEHECDLYCPTPCNKLFVDKADEEEM